MENYLMLNGQRIELTDSQYKEIMNAIGDPAPTKKSSFERQKGENFYSITGSGQVVRKKDWGDFSDEKFYQSGNYCRDSVLMVKRAFYEKVERNLWRFSMENGGSGDYYIFFNELQSWWDWSYSETPKSFGPTFVSKEVASRAIDEVLRPMLKKEKKSQADLFEWKV